MSLGNRLLVDAGQVPITERPALLSSITMGVDGLGHHSSASAQEEYVESFCEDVAEGMRQEF